MNDIVQKIIDEVKKYGDSAIIRYIKKFDSVVIKKNQLMVSEDEIENSISRLSDEQKKLFLQTKRQIEDFHKWEMKRVKPMVYKKNGLLIEQIFKPIERVGIYIPGGRYNYFSTIFMTAIPAKIAGVKDISLATPPKNVTPFTLYISKICGVNRIYRVGGPMAIAALAYGTETIPKVDLIVGPGGKYVTFAKKLVYGDTGVDMLAGPSEVCIYAENAKNYHMLLYDLLSQAEHDPDSKAILLTKNKNLVMRLKKKMPPEYSDRVSFRLLKKTSEIVDFINRVAPEHLQIIARDAESILKKINNAGSISVGEYSPVVIEDYYAGPSHVLPTASSSRFSSGLSVLTFLKKINVIRASKKYIERNYKHISELAQLEGFNYHNKSILCRVKDVREG